MVRTPSAVFAAAMMRPTGLAEPAAASALREHLRDAKPPAADLTKRRPEELLGTQPEAVEHRHRRSHRAPASTAAGRAFADRAHRDGAPRRLRARSPTPCVARRLRGGRPAVPQPQTGAVIGDGCGGRCARRLRASARSRRPSRTPTRGPCGRCRALPGRRPLQPSGRAPRSPVRAARTARAAGGRPADAGACCRRAGS